MKKREYEDYSMLCAKKIVNMQLGDLVGELLHYREPLSQQKIEVIHISCYQTYSIKP